jgi:hypothetical protein
MPGEQPVKPSSPPAAVAVCGPAAHNAPPDAPIVAKTAETDLVDILSTADETAYTWDMNSDRIDWESNASKVLGIDAVGDIATGAGFQMLIAPEHLAQRAQ